MRVAGAQLDLVVGDLDGNGSRIADAMAWADAQNADVLLLPELAITGYPPEDLVLRSGFVEANLAVLSDLARASGSVTTVVGFVDRLDDPIDFDDAETRTVANAAAILRDGAIQGVYHKSLLPNYGVFDETRYFGRGSDPAAIWDINGRRCGVSVCEDIWVPDGPPAQQAAAGAEVLLNINASPFHAGKALEREDMLRSRARASGSHVVYVNLVGGQDELVFDGASVILDRDGTVIHRSPQFEEDLFVVDLDRGGDIAELLPLDQEMYTALVTGLRDYVHKNGFNQVVISLSGGIDSALSAAIAADAIGPESVWASRCRHGSRRRVPCLTPATWRNAAQASGPSSMKSFQ